MASVDNMVETPVEVQATIAHRKKVSIDFENDKIIYNDSESKSTQTPRRELPQPNETIYYITNLERSVKESLDTIYKNRALRDSKRIKNCLDVWRTNFCNTSIAHMPGFKSKVKHLTGYLDFASGEYKAKVQDVIDLYRDKKIRKYETAENAIRDMVNTRSVRNGKADQVHTQIMARCGTAEPMTGRLERERQDKNRKAYTITVYMYKQQADENHNDDISVMVPTGTRAQRQDLARAIRKKKDVPRSGSKRDIFPGFKINYRRIQLDYKPYEPFDKKSPT